METVYEYGRIKILARELRAGGVAEDLTAQIMAGGEAIGKSTTARRKAAWFQGAMERMDALLDESTCHAIRERCACCLGGKRLALSKRIAAEHATFDERLAAANETPFVFGHSVTKADDGRILVRFEAEGKPSYRCVCLPHAAEPLPVSYCYCCGGHVKHHLQIALGCALTCEVRGTALSSGGREPCSFWLTPAT